MYKSFRDGFICVRIEVFFVRLTNGRIYANFFQKFVATENTVCRLFVDIVNAKLKSLFSHCSNNIMTASRLRELIHEQLCNLCS